MQIESKIIAEPRQILMVQDLASIYCEDSSLLSLIEKIKIIKVPDNVKNKVISILEIIKRIKKEHNNIDIVIFGPSEILVDIRGLKDSNKIFQFIKVLMVCITLFLGAGLAIINFHEDVNMEESLSNIYYLITGVKDEQPLLLQIPYSLGLGIGMATFFNHIFKKKWKKEPSPLELEMHTYEKDIDNYILDTTKHNNNNNDGG